MKCLQNLKGFLIALALFFLIVVVGVSALPTEQQENVGATTELHSVSTGVLSVEDVKALLPTDWKIVPQKLRGRGWQQIGMVKMEAEDTVKAVTSLMASRGYSLVQSVTNTTVRSGGIFAYANADGSGRILWSLQQTLDGGTRFSWGVER